MKKTILLVLIALLLLPLSVSADDNTDANELFVEAAQLYQKAQKEADAQTKLKLLNRVLENLDEIVKDYPGSGLAVKLISGQNIGYIQPNKVKKERAAAADFVSKYGNMDGFLKKLGMAFVKIKPGSFMMGTKLSPEQAAKRYGGKAMWYEGQKPLHKVTITKPLYMQTTEVTQGQWSKVMGKNPSEFKGCAQCPVENVSWNDAQKFIARLNKLAGKKIFRLPTEAEWEYACRAGTTTPFNTGKNITTSQANYDGNHPLPGYPKGQYREKTTPVKSFKPNAWGLYDMHGNVWEWCADWYQGDFYKQSPGKDPICKNSASGDRVLRGGCWGNDARRLRSADRGWSGPTNRYDFIGFRLTRITP